MVFPDFLIGLLILVVGATFCFAGYRFFRILIAMWGFFAGFNLGASGMVALFGQTFLGTVTGWVLGIVVGVVIAVLAYFLYYVAIVLLGASVGYAIGSGLIGAIGLNNPGFLAVIVGVVLAVILAIMILVLNLPKLLIMVFTAIGGAATIVTGFLLLFGQIHTAALQYGFAAAAIRASWIWSLVVIVLAVVGFLAQWRTTQEYTLEWSEQSMQASPSS
jgi:Domain of unknown function (DUF4203)